jgi:ankyrin repeat protein
LSIYQLSIGQDHLLGSHAKVIERKVHGRGYISLHIFTKPEISATGELKFLPTTRILESLPTTRIPKSLSAELTKDLENDIRGLTTACSVENSVDLGVLSTTELTTRVRTAPQTSGPASRSIDLMRDLLSSIPSDKLSVRNPSGTSLSASRRKLSTDLLYACKEGITAQVTRLIKTTALIEVETENFHSFRPLHWATVGGHLSVIQVLLSAGAQGDSRASEDWTVIHLAAMMGHIDIIKHFFMWARKNGVTEDSLLHARTRGTLESPLHLAAEFASPEVAEQLFITLYSFGFERWPETCPRNYLDETPLHRAAAANDLTVVMLIEQNTRHTGVHALDQFCRSPLWHAACAGSRKVLRELGARGAVVNLTDDYGRSPLHAACIEGKSDAVSVLLSMGASPNCVTHPPYLTPCHYAALFGHSECLRFLIDRRADADAGTGHSIYFKPIHLAAANGWLQCVEDLCNTGFNPDSRSTHYILLKADGTGGSLVSRETRTAEEIARLQGHSAIVQFFEQRKARQQTSPERSPQ